MSKYLVLLPVKEKMEIIEQLGECMKYVDDKFQNSGLHVYSAISDYRKNIFYLVLFDIGIEVEEFVKKLNERYTRLYVVHDNEITIAFKAGYYRTIDENCIELLKELTKEQ